MEGCSTAIPHCCVAPKRARLSFPCAQYRGETVLKVWQSLLLRDISSQKQHQLPCLSLPVLAFLLKPSVWFPSTLSPHWQPLCRALLHPGRGQAKLITAHTPGGQELGPFLSCQQQQWPLWRWGLREPSPLPSRFLVWRKSGDTYTFHISFCFKTKSIKICFLFHLWDTLLIEELYGFLSPILSSKKSRDYTTNCLFNFLSLSYIIELWYLFYYLASNYFTLLYFSLHFLPLDFPPLFCVI